MESKEVKHEMWSNSDLLYPPWLVSKGADEVNKIGV